MNSASNPLAGFPSAFRLDGKIAVVTSGARGIGRATVAVLAAAGATVSILDRDAATAETSACTIAGDGPTISAHATDVTDEAALERAFGTIVQHRGGVDILINSAGIGLRHPAVDHPMADWDKVVAVNLTGVFLVSRIAARSMISRGGGAIVNLASIMGFSGGTRTRLRALPSGTLSRSAGEGLIVMPIPRPPPRRRPRCAGRGRRRGSGRCRRPAPRRGCRFRRRCADP
jgi:NAD(P)-dependent dehydrogenase (short-subunit alcohol dehydrogenase family)